MAMGTAKILCNEHTPVTGYMTLHPTTGTFSYNINGILLNVQLYSVLHNRQE